MGKNKGPRSDSPAPATSESLTTGTSQIAATEVTSFSAEHPVDDYERTDIKVSAVVVFLIAVAISLALIEFGILELLGRFRTDAALSKTPRSPVAVKVPQPPEPRLQEHPLVDYSRFSEKQNAMLINYGWVNRKQKIVRIPISIALDRVAEHGLPKFATSKTKGKPDEAPPSERSTK